MNLSSELFEQIVTALSNAPAAAGGEALPGASEQRRGGPRVQAGEGARVRLIPLTDSLAPDAVDVTLHDVAPGGARFLYGSRIPLDQQFVLMLPGTDGPVAVLCGVAYWQPVAENCFAIGAKFDRVIRHGSNAGRRVPAAASTGDAVPVRRAV